MKFEELLNNEEFVAKFEACTDMAQGAALIRSYGVDVTEAQLKELAASLQEGEMNADQLDTVAGGAHIFAAARALLARQTVRYNDGTTVKRFAFSLDSLFHKC